MKKNLNTDVIHDGSDGGPIYLDTDLLGIRWSMSAPLSRIAIPGLLEAVTFVDTWGIPAADSKTPEASCRVITEGGHEVRIVGLPADTRVLLWDTKNETDGQTAYYEKVRHHWLTKAVGSDD